MITEQTTINPIKRKRTAIQVAILAYEKWKGEVSFIDDLKDYLATGVVISMPSCFGMAKIIELPSGEPAWFVRMAAGDLPELLGRLPGYLPKICFCRRNDGRLRIYSLERIAQLAARGGK